MGVFNPLLPREQRDELERLQAEASAAERRLVELGPEASAAARAAEATEARVRSIRRAIADLEAAVAEREARIRVLDQPVSRGSRPPRFFGPRERQEAARVAKMLAAWGLVLWLFARGCPFGL